jgi:hypothetical protein
MWITFLFIVAIVGISVILIGIRIFFVRGGHFPHTHIEGNVALKEKGIQCAQSQEKSKIITNQGPRFKHQIQRNEK